MRENKLTILLVSILAVLLFGIVVNAAPDSNIFRNVYPSADEEYYLGTTTKKWLKVWTTDLEATGTATTTELCFGDLTCMTSAAVGGATTTNSWQEPVLDKDLASPPATNITGDRYIVAQGVPECPTGWTEWVEIEIDASKVVATETDYTFWLEFASSTAAIFTSAQTDGDDITFFLSSAYSDITDKLDHQIERYDDTGKYLGAWVKLDSLDSSSNTTLHLCYNNPSATNQEATVSVWNTNWGMAYYMDATGIDESTYGRDYAGLFGTPTANTDFMGLGRTYNGSNQGWSMSDVAYWENTWGTEAVDTTRSKVTVFTTGADVTTRQAIYAEGGGSNGDLLYVSGGKLYMRQWAESNGWGNWSSQPITHQGLTVAANTTYIALANWECIGGTAQACASGEHQLHIMEYGGAFTSHTASSTQGHMNAHSGNGGISYTNGSKDFHNGTGNGVYFGGTIHQFASYDEYLSADTSETIANNYMATSTFYTIVEQSAGGASGDWATHERDIAKCDAGGTPCGTWSFDTPLDGWAVIVLDEDLPYAYDDVDMIWKLFTSSIKHNLLDDLDGGDFDLMEYYHLNLNQYTAATRDATQIQNGLMPAGKLDNWDLAYSNRLDSVVDTSYIDLTLEDNILTATATTALIDYIDASGGGGGAAWEEIWTNAITPTTTGAGIYVTASSTIDSTLRVTDSYTLAGELLDYKFDSIQGRFYFQPQTSATTTRFVIASKDGDGTDNIDFAIAGVGFPGDIENTESLGLSWVAGSNIYTIESGADGTGTIRPLSIFTENNDGQIYLDTDGDTRIPDLHSTSTYMGSATVTDNLYVANNLLINTTTNHYVDGYEYGLNVEGSGLFSFSMYLGGDLTVGGNATVTGQTNLATTTFRFDDGNNVGTLEQKVFDSNSVPYNADIKKGIVMSVFGLLDYGYIWNTTDDQGPFMAFGSEDSVEAGIMAYSTTTPSFSFANVVVKSPGVTKTEPFEYIIFASEVIIQNASSSDAIFGMNVEGTDATSEVSSQFRVASTTGYLHFEDADKYIFDNDSEIGGSLIVGDTPGTGDASGLRLEKYDLGPLGNVPAVNPYGSSGGSVTDGNGGWVGGMTIIENDEVDDDNPLLRFASRDVADTFNFAQLIFGTTTKTLGFLSAENYLFDNTTYIPTLNATTTNVDNFTVYDYFTFGTSTNPIITGQAGLVGFGQYAAPNEFLGVQPSSYAGEVDTALFKTWNNAMQLFLDSEGNVGVATSTTWDGYEFTVDGDSILDGNLLVTGDATTTGHLAALGGNSDEWNTAYSSIWNTASEQDFWNTTSTWAGSEGEFEKYANASSTIGNKAYTDLEGSPSDVITAGTNLSWDGDTLNVAASSGNPFDQWLDTTSSVQFLNVEVKAPVPTGGVTRLSNSTLAISDGDQIGSLEYFTYDTNSPTDIVASISVDAEADFTDSFIDNAPVSMRFKFYDGNTDTVVERMTLYTENFIADTHLGINTTTPMEMLTVAGNSYIEGNSTTTGNFTVASSTDANGTLFVDSTSGNVGIGTTTPFHALDIAGISMKLNTNFADSDVSIWFGNIGSGQDRIFFDNWDVDYYNDNGQTFVGSDDWWIEGRASTTVGLFTQSDGHFGGNLTVDGSATTTEQISAGFNSRFGTDALMWQVENHTLGSGINLPIWKAHNPAMAGAIGSPYVGGFYQGLFLVETDGPADVTIDANPLILFAEDGAGGDIAWIKYATTSDTLQFAQGTNYTFDNDVSLGTATALFTPWRTTFDGGESGTYTADRYLNYNNGGQMEADDGYHMHRAGSVTGVSVSFEVTAQTTAGNIFIEVRNDGGAVFIAAIAVDGVGHYYGYATQARGTDAIAVGDVLTLYVSFPSFVGTLSDTCAFMEVVFDS